MSNQKILIRVIEANLTRDTDAIGKMDPFVLITHKGKSFRSKTKIGGGKTPKWENQEYELPFDDANELV